MTQAYMLLLGFPEVSEEEYWQAIHYLENNQQHQWPPQQMLWLASYRDQNGWLWVAEGYSDPTAISFELMGQVLQASGIAIPTERALFPVTYLSPADTAEASALPWEQLVVLQACYPQAGLAEYQRVMAHLARAQFTSLVVIHAGGAEENTTVHVFTIFPNQDAADQALALLGPVFAELQSPAVDRQLTGSIIDFRWLAADAH